MENRITTIRSLFNRSFLVLSLCGTIFSLRGAEQTKGDGEGIPGLLARGTLAEERGDVKVALAYYREAVAEYDRVRRVAAQALLRQAETYQALGATESADASYARLRLEFADQPGLLASVPEGVVVTKRRDRAAKLDETIVYSSDENETVYLESEDPRRILLQEELDQVRRRVHSTAQSLDDAFKQLQEAKIRLSQVNDANVLTLPDLVRPGLRYEELRGAWESLHLTSRLNEVLENQYVNALRRIEQWVAEKFIPELEAAVGAAERGYAMWHKEHSEQKGEYQVMLEQLRHFDEDVRAERKERDRIEQENRQVFTIVGEIRNPGRYEGPRDLNIGIVEAVALAGGFNQMADQRVVEVSRQGVILKFNVRDELDLAPDKRFQLHRDDIVSVPEKKLF